MDIDTKRRIDTARDILVGKLPDPKSQVEQITIALIYKFMDDMDKQSEELGGKAKFFTGEFEKYSWSKIFDPRVSGHELVILYAEAIEKMDHNPNIPPLFREIFKNAYLPYRDPETLRMFLKVIGEFEYDHSERLGDSYEQLLSIMGSQGDAGQFRTPRHIIDFMVEVTDPQKSETILDPACGTAGFLIFSYNHILDKNRIDNNVNLSPEERANLVQNIVGYDISPDMVRIALVNMYLHGFQNPKIYEYDTLASEDRWNDYFDIILANPPFMSPRGGVRPHKRFSIQSKRSEVLFVDYIAEHLTPHGRGAVIVPEGIIFQSGNAYKKLRQSLIENSLYAVVSLPAGVFNPYSGVKTSILFLNKNLAKKTNDILFVKISNDGFNLGAQRRKIKENDLPLALEIIQKYQQSINENKKMEFNPIKKKIAHLVKKEKIAESGDYNLSGNRYKETMVYSGKWDFLKLEEVFREIKNGKNVKQISEKGKYRVTRIQTISSGYFDLNSTKWTNDLVNEKDFMQIGDILLSHINSYDHLGKSAIFLNNSEKVVHGVNLIRLKPNLQLINPIFAIYIFKSETFIRKVKSLAQRAVNQASVRTSNLKNIQIPLPPLEIQEQIVNELESYQKIIDGARQIVENYKPTFKIDPDWDFAEIGNIFETSSGGTPLKSRSEYYDNGNIPWINSGEVNQGYITKANHFINEKGLKNSSAKIFPKDTVLIAMYGATAGQVGFLNIDAATNQAICGIYPNKEYYPLFLYYFLKSSTSLLRSFSVGGAQPNISQNIIRSIKIPFPDLETQKKIVSCIESEQKMIDANKELIKIYEQKIREKIAEVWGE